MSKRKSQPKKTAQGAAFITRDLLGNEIHIGDSVWTIDNEAWGLLPMVVTTLAIRESSCVIARHPNNRDGGFFMNSLICNPSDLRIKLLEVFGRTKSAELSKLLFVPYENKDKIKPVIL
jgi:hypothetical protein